MVLAGGIAAATFAYQDVNGAITGTSADIRRVVITITAQPQFQPAATQQGRALVTMQDTLRLRNRLQ